MPNRIESLAGFSRPDEDKARQHIEILHDKLAEFRKELGRRNRSHSKAQGEEGLKVPFSLLGHIVNNNDTLDYVPSLEDAVQFAEHQLKELKHFSEREVILAGSSYLEKLRGDALSSETRERFIDVFETDNTDLLGDSEVLTYWYVKCLGEIAEMVTEGTISNAVFYGSPDNRQWHGAQISFALSYLDQTLDSSPIELLNTEDLDPRQTRVLNTLSQGFRIGYFYRDAWWLENHAEAAANYYEHAKDWKTVQAARNDGARTTRNKSQKQKADARNLVRQAISERGMLFVTATERHKAETIMGIAEKTRPEDFEFQKGKLRPHSWFLEQIEEMRAQGELAEIASEELQKT